LDLRNDGLTFRFCERRHESIEIRKAIGLFFTGHFVPEYENEVMFIGMPHLEVN
jgi:hypothetical protein